MMQNSSARLIATSLFSLTLIACCSSNPLMKQSPKERAKALMYVSNQAVKSLELQGINGEDAYRQCMKGHLSHKTCTRLFDTMSELFEKQGVRISPKKVADKTMYQRTSLQLDRFSYLIE